MSIFKRKIYPAPAPQPPRAEAVVPPPQPPRAEAVAPPPPKPPRAEAVVPPPPQPPRAEAVAPTPSRTDVVKSIENAAKVVLQSLGMSKIEINTTALANAANQIETSSQRMRDKSDEIESLIKSLGNNWDSSVQSDFHDRVRKTKEVYDSYEQLLSDISHFLNLVADAYCSNERRIQKSASRFS